MPRHKEVPNLYSESVRAFSAVVLDTVRRLDDTLHSTAATAGSSAASSPNVSPMSASSARLLLPPSSPGSTSSEAADSNPRLAQHWQLAKILSELPVHVAEDIVAQVLMDVEYALEDDRDRKLILTLINIERSKPSDLLFGMHALLTCLQRVPAVHKVSFTSQLWYCLRDYDEISCSSYLGNHLFDCIPKLENLVQLNVAYVANDKLCFLIGRHLRHLEDLCLEKSSVTDSSLKSISGVAGVGMNPVVRIEPLGSLPLSRTEPGLASPPLLLRMGCKKLRRLVLTDCHKVTESAVWSVLMHLKNIEVLRYHQSYSMAEILNKEVSLLSDSELASKKLKLNHYSHPFPYALSVFQPLVAKVVAVCPFITHLNIVTTDDLIPVFTCMTHLHTVLVELEDCFGLGLDKFLQERGSHIKELSITCSSDSDSTTLAGGGQPFQMFNAGLRLARHHCAGRSSVLRKLSVAGCGLVANDLLRKLEATPDSALPVLAKLESLVLLSYEDDSPVQACEERMLMDTLQGCSNLRCLSMEGNFSSFLNDRFVMTLLKRNPMPHLQIFDVSGSPVNLSAATADLLLTLPRIRELRVTAWKNLTDADFERLKRVVLANGWDLFITRQPRLQQHGGQPHELQLDQEPLLPQE